MLILRVNLSKGVSCMRQLFPFRKIPPLFILLPLLLYLLAGCSGKPILQQKIEEYRDEMRAENDKEVMRLMQQMGTGDEKNRRKYDDQAYRDGYDKGYASGYREGIGDYQRKEGYSPSLKDYKSDRRAYDYGYVTGFEDG